MGVRRLLALVRGLPPDSATWRQEHGWGHQEELLASLLELTDAWGRALAQLLGGRVQGKPLRIQRPGEQREQAEPESPPVETDPNAIARFFGLKARGGEGRA